ncbi:MAG: polysaccharide pyruvyl transferase CsaB [Ruminococcaceae bacterium]|nr:polysaccharide pyruvyl transferase CsaB [Oscillospiraceae bacterium]
MIYDIMLSGYYGFGNSGDEALLQMILQDLRVCRPGLSIVVLSQNPEETARMHHVKAVNRMDLKEIFRILKKTKLLISGGGSLIQDATSSKSLYYYLTLIGMAKKCGCKVMLYANGIGPVDSSLNRLIAGKILNRVDLITLRDPDSLIELRKMNVDIPEITVTADPALRLKECSEEKSDELLCRYGCNQPPIIISLRNWKTFDETICKEVKRYMVEMRSRYGCKSLLLPMQPSEDTEICRMVAKGTDAMVLENLKADEVLGLMKKSAAVVGMRLHSLIYAASVGAAPVGIVYDPKVQGYLCYLGLESYLSVEKIDAQELVRLTALARESEYGSMMSNMKKKAIHNAELAVSLL